MRTSYKKNLQLISMLAICLVQGIYTSEAQTVVFGDAQSPLKATEIKNLDVAGTSYNVTFPQQVTANGVYGGFPGTFTFNTNTEAEAAVDAVMAALNNDGAISVGEASQSGVGSEIFNIGYEEELVGSIESIHVWRAGYDVSNNWTGLGQNTWTYNLDERSYAAFSITTGLDEASLDKNEIKVEVYPNPTNGLVSFSSLPSQGEIKVSDYSGRLVKILRIEQGEQTYNISELPGLYFIQVFNQDQNVVSSSKVIVE
jgi:hypothetical protein